MKLLTRETDYALRTLLFLASSSDTYFSAKKISENEKIPYSFLRRILHALRKNGLIEAREGVFGGVRIRPFSRKKGLLDIIRIFQGDISISCCVLGKNICINRAKCVLMPRVKKIEELVEKEFRKITLSSLLREKDKKGGNYYEEEDYQNRREKMYRVRTLHPGLS